MTVSHQFVRSCFHGDARASMHPKLKYMLPYHRLVSLCSSWLLSSRRLFLNLLNGGVLVLGSDLDSTFGLGSVRESVGVRVAMTPDSLDHADDIWQVLGRSHLALGVERLHTAFYELWRRWLWKVAHILTLIPNTPCLRRTCRTA
jgi:hypothetical protein